MSNYVSNMISSQGAAVALFHEYIMIKDDYPYFYYFEGNDDYYFYDVFVGIVDSKLRGFKKHASGKYQLKEAVESIMKYQYTNKDNLMFFFDGDYSNRTDFNQLINDYHDNIFMLDRYSIENYMVNKETILTICKRFFKYIDGNVDYLNLVKYYDEQFKQFMKCVFPLNKYKYIHEKIRNEGINLRDFDQKSPYLKFNQFTKIYDYECIDYSRLDSYFQCTNCISHAEDVSAKQFFICDQEKKFRGHNQLHFMKAFFTNINQKALNKEEFFVGHDNKKFNFNGIIENYSIYAEVPEGIKKFINDHVYSWVGRKEK